jgi:hypothetical protein
VDIIRVQLTSYDTKSLILVDVDEEVGIVGIEVKKMFELGNVEVGNRLLSQPRSPVELVRHRRSL